MQPIKRLCCVARFKLVSHYCGCYFDGCDAKLVVSDACIVGARSKLASHSCGCAFAGCVAELVVVDVWIVGDTARVSATERDCWNMSSPLSTTQSPRRHSRVRANDNASSLTHKTRSDQPEP